MFGLSNNNRSNSSSSNMDNNTNPQTPPVMGQSKHNALGRPNNN